mmetsp:Transcript_2531/g.4906  ORF Transcript_2531/g.4906 Transcript_2531/m.4906 type:complete len:641 (-) Transcript_2531:78-2000(-)
MEAVHSMQKGLEQLFDICQQVKSGAAALSTATDRIAGKERAVSMEQIEALMRRTEQATTNLVNKDQNFRKGLREAAANPAIGIHAKKLKRDYDQRLDVATTLEESAAVLKRARLALKTKQREQAEESRKKATQQAWLKQHPNSLQAFSGLQTYAVREHDQSEEEVAQLSTIAKDAALLEQMATEVGSLIAVQQDDIDKLEENNSDSVARAISGVHELSQLRKNQAGAGTTKASLGAASIGALTGLLGGPLGIAIGALAGGAAGALAGKGVAAVKRRSINSETKRVKALLAARKKQSGEFVHQVHVYEIQSWSMLQRNWQTRNRAWVDEYGDPVVGINPSESISPAEARLNILESDLRSVSIGKDASEQVKEQQVIFNAHNREVQLGIQWEWASAHWTPVLDRPNSDLQGWDFAPNPTSEKWQAEATRTSMVRRKLWVRYLVGKLPSEANPARKDTVNYSSEMLRTPNASVGGSKSSELWDGIYTSSRTTNSILTESLQQVGAQGEQVQTAERDATVVGDAAVLSERIERASHLSGALRNMLSWQKGNLRETESFAQELQERRKINEQVREATTKDASQVAAQNIDIADATSKTFAQSLHLATSLQGELDIQNSQLDRTASAVERGNDGMLRVTKRISRAG